LIYIAFDSNIRVHEAHNKHRLNYSYVNLKKVPGHKSDAIPFASVYIKNESICVKECLKTNGICKNINLKTCSIDVYECEINLATDIYHSDLIQERDYNHYVIKVRMGYFFYFSLEE